MRIFTTTKEKVSEPVYKKIKVSLIKVAPYQREINLSRVRRYSKSFDWDVFGVPLISLRNGNFYIIDGQHRIELLKSVGVEDVLCQVLYGLTYEEEAKKFVKLNSERGSLTANQKFHGRVESKDETALKIVSILSDNGFTYSTKSGMRKDDCIGAISCVENIYKSCGEKHLNHVLHIIRESWYGLADSLSRDIIAGVSTFLAESRGVKDDILCAALEEEDPKNIILRALVCAGSGKVRMGVGNSPKKPHVAKAIRDIYNDKKMELAM